MSAPTGSENLVGKEFIITRECAAPRELVWKACTEAERLAQWWGPRGFTAPVCEWDAKPGNRIYVVMRGRVGRTSHGRQVPRSRAALQVGDHHRCAR